MPDRNASVVVRSRARRRRPTAGAIQMRALSPDQDHAASTSKITWPMKSMRSDWRQTHCLPLVTYIWVTFRVAVLREAKRFPSDWMKSNSANVDSL